MLSQFATGDAGIWLAANQVKKWEYRQIEKTHVSPWEQHSHPFTRHIDVSPIRSHIVHLDRVGCSTSLLMRPGQLFRPHALPCLLFYGRQNLNPSSVSLYAAFFGSWPRFLHELFVFFLPPLPYFISQTKNPHVRRWWFRVGNTSAWSMPDQFYS